MSTNIKTAVVVGGSGSGILVNIQSSVTLNNGDSYSEVSRLIGFHYTVAADGDFLVSGDKQVSDITAAGQGASGLITRIHAVSTGGNDVMLPYSGMVARGIIRVSAPTSVAKLTVFYE